ncbi:MAG: DUF5615 family PIN-like protein [Nitrospirota bacterium]
MKLVIDENVSYGLVKALRDTGNEVVSIAEATKRGISDISIFTLAKESNAVLLTRDYHFTNPIRFEPGEVESIIYIRPGNLTSNEEIEIVMGFFKKYSLIQFKGKLITLYKNSIRIR